MAKNLVAIDVGNTAVKIGLFSRATNELLRTAKWDQNENTELGTYIKLLKDLVGSTECDSAVSSVVPKTGAKIKAACQQIFGQKPTTPSSQRTTSIKINYATESSFGEDRLVNLIGASSLVEKTAFIVVNHGTCLVIDLVDKNRNHLGGVIMPGIKASAKALADYTALLPLIAPKITYTAAAYGNSTEKCIEYGLVNGCEYMVRGTIERMKSSLDGQLCAVVVTGGDYGYARADQQYEGPFIAESHLSLIGLQLLHSMAGAR